MKLLYTILTVALSATALVAQPGFLDNSFNGTGKKTFRLSPGGNVAYDVAVQSDQRIIVVGQIDNGGSSDVLALRLKPDGTVDSTFGANGSYQTGSKANINDVCFGVQLQPDGKILLGCKIEGISPVPCSALLIRLLPDGTPDPQFGDNGRVQTDFTVCRMSGIALQSDGKVVMTGWVRNGTVDGALVLRYTADGKPDSSFGSGGKVVYLRGNDFCHGAGVAVQPDGKIVVSGSVYYNLATGSYDIMLLRLNSNGTLDSVFGTDGYVATDIRNASEQAFKVLLQPDGKIVVGGYVTDSQDNEDEVIVRYNADGTLDKSFNSTGSVILNRSSEAESINAIYLMPNGKILACGYCTRSTKANFSLLRVNANGTVDNGFGSSGLALADVGTVSQANGIAVQNDGKIVLCGKSWTESEAITDIGVARFQSELLTGIPFAIQSDLKVQLVPNPSSGSASLDISLKTASTVSVIATDINGRVVGEPITRAVLSAGKHTIPLTPPESLPTGVYPVIVDVDGRRLVVMMEKY